MQSSNSFPIPATEEIPSDERLEIQYEQAVALRVDRYMFAREMDPTLEENYERFNRENPIEQTLGSMLRPRSGWTRDPDRGTWTWGDVPGWDLCLWCGQTRETAQLEEIAKAAEADGYSLFDAVELLYKASKLLQHIKAYPEREEVLPPWEKKNNS